MHERNVKQPSLVLPGLSFIRSCNKKTTILFLCPILAPNQNCNTRPINIKLINYDFYMVYIYYIYIYLTTATMCYGDDADPIDTNLVCSECVNW